VNSIDRWDGTVFQFARDRLVRREHELLDQLMRLVVLYPLHRDRLAFGVQPHFHFRKIEIERALLKTLLAQKRRQFPSHVESLAELVFGGRLQQRVSFAVS
jgi:hypothetical protein